MRKTCLLILLLASCSSCAGLSRYRGFESDGIRSVVKSSYRIKIYCSKMLWGYGSGVAVSPQYLLTARHVANACNGGPVKMEPEFVAIGYDGDAFKLVPDQLADGAADTARLIIVGMDLFPSWTRISHALPRYGQPVLMFAGDGSMDKPGEWRFQFKRGVISNWTDDSLVVSIHAVPGNSGAGIFDEDGDLMAILWGGVWRPDEENYAEGWRFGAWRELVPMFPEPRVESPNMHDPNWPFPPHWPPGVPRLRTGD